MREFLAKGHAVISAALGPSAATDLKATGAERLALDVADPASIAALAATLRGRPVDILIDNAGLGERADMPRLDYDRFKEVLRVNTTAPIRGLDALTPNLAAGKNKKAAALSRQPGSIQNTDMSFCLA